MQLITANNLGRSWQPNKTRLSADDYRAVLSLHNVEPTRTERTCVPTPHYRGSWKLLWDPLLPVVPGSGPGVPMLAWSTLLCFS